MSEIWYAVIAVLVVYDAAMFAMWRHERRAFLQRERERFDAQEHEHAREVPAAKVGTSLRRDENNTWRTVEASASAPRAVTAFAAPSQSSLRRPRSFEDRCGQAIADVLNDAGIGFRAYVSPRDNRPRPVKSLRTDTFFVILSRPADLEKTLGLDERLAMMAGIESARVARYGAKVGIEFMLPSSMWQPLPLDAPGRGSEMRLGRNTLNQAVHLDLASPATPHALLAGTTGCGKTTLLRTMLYQIALADPAEHKLLLIDSKAAPALKPFYSLPHLLAPVAIDPDDALKALAWTAAEIMRRRTSEGPPPTLTLAIDEIALLMSMTGQDASRPLATILSVGREHGVRVIAGTQKVTARWLGDGMITANFSARLAGAVTDANESRLATGQPGLYAQRLSGKGDFLAVAGGQAHRFTVATVSDAQLASLPHVDVVEDATGSVDLAPLAMIETVAPGQAPLPTTPAQYAATLSAYVHGGHVWPGIGKMAQDLGVGKVRAERIRGEAQDLAELLSRAGVALARNESMGKELG